MKTLYLLRHAKSSWKDENLNDFDRPLNKRGLKDAPFMANFFKDEIVTDIDVIVSSPALRAKVTALEFQKKLGCTLLYEQKLYDRHFDSIEDVVRDFNDIYDNVIVVGHNPSFNSFASKFAFVYENIPTAGIVGVKFDVNSWKDITEDRAIFKCFEYPKLYRF